MYWREAGKMEARTDGWDGVDLKDVIVAGAGKRLEEVVVLGATVCLSLLK